MLVRRQVAGPRVVADGRARRRSDPYALGQVLYKATALVLTGLSVSVALDAGLFNIGAEGQVIAGVVACAVVGAALPASTPAIVAIPLCIARGRGGRRARRRRDRRAARRGAARTR